MLTAISYFYLDTGIAQFIYRILNSSDRLLQAATDIPDLLLHIVITITVLSWVGYFILVRRGIHNRHTDFLRICGTVVPMACRKPYFNIYSAGPIHTPGCWNTSRHVFPGSATTRDTAVFPPGT